jgi:Nitrate/nitrite transporter
MRREEKLNKNIVLSSAIGVSVILGILYVWSVISKGLMNELGWSSTQASLPYTVFTVFMSLGFFTAGRVQDKIGPRWCVAGCAILMGIGLVLSGLITTPTLVMIGFGVICGFGVGAGNEASLSPTLKWWPSRKKGMVSGAVLAGIGFSAVIYAPVSNIMLSAVGVSNSFLIYGTISFVLMFLLSFNMYDPPVAYDKELGRVVLKSGSETTTTASSEKVAEKESAPLLDRDFTTIEMLKTRNFYLMFIIFAISTASGLMIIAHAAKIAQVQVGWEGGFLLVIVLNLFNTMGRFLGGSISDKIGRVNTLRLTFAIQAINMFLFSNYTNVPLIVVGILIQGFCYGTIFANMPALNTDMYGYKNFGHNYGTLFLAWGIGGIIGPMTAAHVFDTASLSMAATEMSGAYHDAYLIACVLSVISFALMFAIKRRPKQVIESS